jgi:hypothetical protein
VSPGVYDLVAKTEPPNERVLIRHDVSALSDLAEPDIDMTTEGVAMIAVPLVISGASGDTQTLTSLNTRNGIDLVSITNSMTAMVVPPAILQSQDHQSVEVYSFSQPVSVDGGTRSGLQQAQSSYPLADPSIMLRSPPDVSYEYAATGLLARVNVDSVPPASQWALRSETGCPPPSCASTQVFSAQSVIATAAWRRRHDPASLAFDTSAPGYQGSWSVDFAKSHVRSFGAVDESNGTTYSTVSVDAINGAMLTMPHAPRGTLVFPRQSSQ